MPELLSGFWGGVVVALTTVALVDIAFGWARRRWWPTERAKEAARNYPGPANGDPAGVD